MNENEFEKKSSKKGLIITLGCIVLILIALVLAYFFVYTSPKFVFSKGIDKLFDSKTEEYETLKVGVGIKAEIDSNNDQINEINNILKDCKFNFATQLDIKNKKEIVEIGLDYDKEKVASAQMFYDDGEEYIYLDELFDKYIKLDIEEEVSEEIEKMFDTMFDTKRDTDKAKGIIKEEIKDSLKKQAEFSKETTDITINEEDVKVNKNTLKINQKKFYEIIKKVCTNLKGNEDFLDCFDESPKDFLNEIIDSTKELLEDEEYNTKSKIEINIYTKGLLNEFVGLELEIYNANEDIKTIVSFIKIDENIIDFSVKYDNEELKSNVKIEKTTDKADEKEGKITISTEIPEVGNLILTIDYTMKIDGKIDEIDLDNIVDMDDLTEEDRNTILNNLKERPLIGEYIEAYLENRGLLERAQDASMETEMAYMQEEQILNPNINIDETEKNVVTFSPYKVTFSIPEGYTYNTYSSIYYKSFSKEAIDVTLNIKWGTDEDILDDIKWNLDYYTDSEYYENVTLGEMKTVTVGDKQFKYQILNYEYSSEYFNTKYQTAYVWYVLDEDYSFTVEIESQDEEITEDIIKGFLDIKVEKTN